MVEPMGVATLWGKGWAAGNERASGFAGARVGVRGAKPLAAGWGNASVPPATEGDGVREREERCQGFCGTWMAGPRSWTIRRYQLSG
jgi:hypothetical protein